MKTVKAREAGGYLLLCNVWWHINHERSIVAQSETQYIYMKMQKPTCAVLMPVTAIEVFSDWWKLTKYQCIINV